MKNKRRIRFSTLIPSSLYLPPLTAAAAAGVSFLMGRSMAATETVLISLELFR